MRTKKLFTLVLLGILILIVHIVFVSACEEDWQIDVNTASKEELQIFTGIGPVKAQLIIDYRTNKLFENVDELIEVDGIGPTTLQNMKDEGACVNEDNQKSDDDQKEEGTASSRESTNDGSPENGGGAESVQSSQTRRDIIIEPEAFEIIELIPKDIKSEKDVSGTGSGYALCGFVAFSILIGILFLMQRNKYKNEFR